MADIGPWRVPKSGYVTITKIENVHIDVHVEKFTDSKNAILFDLWRKLTKLLRKNRVRTVASPGACERLAVYRSSSMHPSSLALLNACCSYFFPVFVWWAVWDAMACWVTLSRWPTAIRLLVIRSTIPLTLRVDRLRRVVVAVTLRQIARHQRRHALAYFVSPKNWATFIFTISSVSVDGILTVFSRCNQKWQRTTRQEIFRLTYMHRSYISLMWQILFNIRSLIIPDRNGEKNY